MFIMPSVQSNDGPHDSTVCIVHIYVIKTPVSVSVMIQVH